MAYTLGNKCAKNLCKRIVLLQLIIENVVTCFFLEHSVVVLAGQSLGRRKICPAILDFRFLLLCLESGILESRISSSVMWSQYVTYSIQCMHLSWKTFSFCVILDVILHVSLAWYVATGHELSNLQWLKTLSFGDVLGTLIVSVQFLIRNIAWRCRWKIGVSKYCVNKACSLWCICSVCLIFEFWFMRTIHLCL